MFEFCIICVTIELYLPGGFFNMGFYSINTNELQKNGLLSISNPDSISSPYNFLSKDQTNYFTSKVPFSLQFTTYFSNSENPFRTTMLAPNFSMNTILSREEFHNLVLPHCLHQHDTYELIYVLDGVLYQRIENSRHMYIENSSCFINRNVRHQEEYVTDFRTVNLSLSRDYLFHLLEENKNYCFEEERTYGWTELSHFFAAEYSKEVNQPQKKYIDFIPNEITRNKKAEIFEIFDEITHLILNPTIGTSLMIKALIYKIMFYLNEPKYFHTIPITLGTPTESQIFALVTKLMEQTNGRISRSELSEKLNYSGNYINRIVQKYSGMNIYKYGTSITLQRASQYLCNTDKTISEIIDELGFSDRTHFYKLFKDEYHVTPRKYRLMHTAHDE